MKKNKLPKHLEESMANLKFCIEHCGMNDEEIEEMLKAIDKLKIARVQHFCEEFIFMVEGTTPDENIKYHCDDYFNIAQFNSMYWEQKNNFQ